MTVLFVSVVCDHCNPPDDDDDHRQLRLGYVVYRSRPPGSCEYVFETQDDAARWRAASGLERFPIKQVLTPGRFRWRSSVGPGAKDPASLRNIRIADRLYEIYAEGHKDLPEENHNIAIYMD